MILDGIIVLNESREHRIRREVEKVVNMIEAIILEFGPDADRLRKIKNDLLESIR